jgi:hypothetical protein
VIRVYDIDVHRSTGIDSRDQRRKLGRLLLRAMLSVDRMTWQARCGRQLAWSLLSSQQDMIRRLGTNTRVPSTRWYTLSGHRCRARRVNSVDKLR